MADFKRGAKLWQEALKVIIDFKNSKPYQGMGHCEAATQENKLPEVQHFHEWCKTANTKERKDAFEFGLIMYNKSKGY